MNAYRFLSRGWRPGQGGTQYGRFTLPSIPTDFARFLVELTIMALSVLCFWLAFTQNRLWFIAAIFWLLYDILGIVILRKGGYEQFPIDSICDWWKKRTRKCERRA